MTEQEIKEWKEKIDAMSHYEMAWLWRYAPCGHPIFSRNNCLFDYFNTKFKEFGGMTPAVSKAIGW